MALATITDVEDALGSDIPAEDEGRVQWYLDVISAFITAYTGVSFEPKDDAVVVAESDGKGIIEIAQIRAITKVEALDPYTGIYSTLPNPSFPAPYGYAFNGIDKIMGLCPRETYRITLDYGYATVPEDIKGIVVLLTMAGTGLDYTAVNGLKSYRVGDVEESYGVSMSETGEPAVTLSRLMSETLDAYATGTTTYRL